MSVCYIFCSSPSRSEGSRSPSPERPTSKKRQRIARDVSDDENLRDSEEEEDDEDYEFSRRARNRKKKKGSEFIITEAEVDEDADEEDEDYYDDDGAVLVSVIFKTVFGISKYTILYSCIFYAVFG